MPSTHAPPRSALLYVCLGLHGRLLPVFGFVLQHARTPSRAQGPAIQMCTPDRSERILPDWMEAGLARVRLKRGYVQRFQSQDDYEEQRARLESFEMSAWSPTDMEKACYEEQASQIFRLYAWIYPDHPDWDLKSHLEYLRRRARWLAAGRVPDGVSMEGLEASRSQCAERDRLMQEKADHDRRWEESDAGRRLRSLTTWDL